VSETVLRRGVRNAVEYPHLGLARVAAALLVANGALVEGVAATAPVER
jgi:hypothetical protein